MNKAVNRQLLPSSIFHLLVILACVFVITFGLFYGMIAEVELRELKADRMTYNMILADRALAERAVAREWSR